MYDEDAYKADTQKVSELMGKMDKVFHGYSRSVIVLACARSIAAMLGPVKQQTRDNFIARFPSYMRAMWRTMDESFRTGPS